MTGPQFSVILAVYNGESRLGRAIDSVRSQTDPDWEIVAVDDGSTDSSWEILTEASRDDPRIRTFRTSNSGGPARPRNIGIREARGEAICFLDQDDLWLPEKLTLQRPLLERPEVGVVYGDAWVEDNDHERRLYSDLWGAGFCGEVTSQLIESNFIPALTAVIPASVVRSVGPLNERLVGVDDYHLWLRIAMAGYRVEGLSRPVAVYSVTGENLSRDHDLYLRSLDSCLRDLERRHPLWRDALSERRETERLHAFDYFANRLATRGLTHRGGLQGAVRVSPLIRNWSEAKRVIVSCVPPRFRPQPRSERRRLR
ncbi:MAG: glycosyltransferase [Acidimicrobiales bacterium]